jgi:hypothetical protein
MAIGSSLEEVCPQGFGTLRKPNGVCQRTVKDIAMARQVSPYPMKQRRNLVVLGKVIKSLLKSLKPNANEC